MQSSMYGDVKTFISIFMRVASAENIYECNLLPEIYFICKIVWLYLHTLQPGWIFSNNWSSNFYTNIPTYKQQWYFSTLKLQLSSLPIGMELVNPYATDLLSCSKAESKLTREASTCNITLVVSST